MNLVTGYFGKPHISTNQDSMWHRGIWDSDCIIAVNGTENLAADIVSNNEIQVKSGVLQMQGRFSEIPLIHMIVYRLTTELSERIELT